VKYWRKVNGNLNETLVFDCKFTTYGVLDELKKDGVKFITLRKRHAALLKATEALPKEKWQKIFLPIPKRKYTHVSVFEEVVRLKGCKNSFRQITIKDHGRPNRSSSFIINVSPPLIILFSVSYSGRLKSLPEIVSIKIFLSSWINSFIAAICLAML
jgi:hypothetical protein